MRVGRNRERSPVAICFEQLTQTTVQFGATVSESLFCIRRLAETNKQHIVSLFDQTIADLWRIQSGYTGNVYSFQSGRSPGYSAFMDPDSPGGGYRSLVPGT
jgi:hypothetical protein